MFSQLARLSQRIQSLKVIIGSLSIGLQPSRFMANHMFVNNPTAINHASDLLAAGELIAVPTDTVYGICCNAENVQSIRKLFDVKGRSVHKSVSLCFSMVQDIEKWADTSYINPELLNALLPGPVTLVLNAKNFVINKLISNRSGSLSGRVSIGVRIPDNIFIRRVCLSQRFPLALTSANLSGVYDSINVDEFKSLWPFLGCVFDQGCLGPSVNRSASTVLDMTVPNIYKVIRTGVGVDKVLEILQSVRSGSGNKETLIRNSITTQLSESVKEIQLCGLEENFSGDSMDMGDASNNLCSIIEAMFLHGLKDSLVHKARRVIGNDIDQRPEPNFWSPLLIFSHRQIIDQITALPNITTEIGQCRAWIRIALNDSLLSSYLTTMVQDTKSLKPFYKSFAYIRDADLLDVTCKLIESVELYNVFTLPCNSSLLNNWPLPTLLLAGIWSPPLRQCPITSGVDVAQSLDNMPSLKANSNACSIGSVMSVTSYSSGLGKMLALNEDEALKIILANSAQEEITSSQTIPEIVRIESSPEVKNQPDTSSEEPSSLGNSLNRKSGWSFDDGQNKLSYDSSNTPQMNRSVSLEGARSNEHSYHALIESYNLVSGPFSKVPDLQEVWQRFGDACESGLESCERQISQDLTTEDQMDFEFITASTLDKSDASLFLTQIGRLAQEKGLDTQNYECFGCKHPLGINLCKPRICAFTGDCYCDTCMTIEPIMIPARIIHNWDFKLYHVSKKAYMFLHNEIKNHPVLDFKILNPYIYKGVEEMAKLENLRIQLNYLRDYIFTCREPVIEQFKRLVWPKEYLYEHIHQYSISDLAQISGGNLTQLLQKLVNFGREHVSRCWLCGQKGFVCEICSKPKILYPFDVETTYRCDLCNAVYHIHCLDFSKPCPKCERRRKREEISLLDATLE